MAAARGHLDCLNLILGHNIDITASDAAGKFRLNKSGFPQVCCGLKIEKQIVIIDCNMTE